MLKVPMHTIIKEYSEKQVNGHWFDDDAMRFFNCRLPNYGYLNGDTTLFISSERFSEETKRFFTIRAMQETGAIITIGDFNKMTRVEARKKMAEILDCKVKDL